MLDEKKVFREKDGNDAEMSDDKKEAQQPPTWHFTCHTLAGELAFRYEPGHALEDKVNEWVGDVLADIIKKALKKDATINPYDAMEFLLDDLEPHIGNFREYVKEYVWTHIVAKLHEAMGSLLKEALLQAMQTAPINGKPNQIRPQKVKEILLKMDTSQKKRLRIPVGRGRPGGISKEEIMKAIEARRARGDELFIKGLADDLNQKADTVRKALKAKGIDLNGAE
jgi:hypothetical protein